MILTGALGSKGAMDTTIVVLSLLTGLLTGALFRFLQIPIPAPPNIAGVMGIVGIFLGYALIEHFDFGIDVVEALGL